MLTFANMKILKNIILSHERERKRYYSSNSDIITNTLKCQEHNEHCRKICLECNIDICPKCEKNFHNSHKITRYEDINPDSSEIENLQNKIKIYIDKCNNLKKEINNWNKEIQNKLYDFEITLKHNEIINSIDFITNYNKNKICLNSILKFRRIYHNVMDENNSKNRNFINVINQFGNNDNMNLPPYCQYLEIKNLLQNLNYNSNNLFKKTEYIINYLSKIPSMTNINIFNNYNFNYITNDNTNRSNSISNYNYSYKSHQYNNIFNEPKLTDSMYDNSTGYKNNNENNLSISSRNVEDKNVDNFKKILSKTKIPEFNLNNQPNNKLNKTYNYGEKKNYNFKDITKYLNKLGYLNINKEDITKVNSSQDLLNKSSYSIKSTKYVQLRSNSSNFNFTENSNTNNNIIRIKSSLNSMKYNTIENTNTPSISALKKEEIKPNFKKISNIHPPVYINKNTQTKTYVHKKFNSSLNNKSIHNINNINKINDVQSNKVNITNITNVNKAKDKKVEKYKFQKKIIIINKSNRRNNNKKEDSNKKRLLTDINQKQTQNQSDKNFKINLIKQKIIRTKQSNENMITNSNNDNNDNIYTSPIKPEIFKNAIINDDKKNIVNDYDNDNTNNEINNMNTNDKKVLINQILCSPSENIGTNINKNLNYDDLNKNINNNINDNNITFQTFKINNSTSNLNTPNIIKTYKNSSFFVDPDKELCLGLELGNSECKVGIVNQNTSEIQLVCFGDNKYSIPTLVSFVQNKKEIKIGHKAAEEILSNPSQTIFNIIKYFGKKYNEVSCNNKLWPFKVYSSEEKNKPYIKVNLGPQKDKVFYFENILSIFLEKMFEFIFKKVNLENSSNYNTQEKIKGDGDELSVRNTIYLKCVLVITVPNYFSYYQRKLIKKIIKTEIFPDISNNEISKVYGKYKINLIEIRIENASSIASICLNNNYNFNFNFNLSNQKNKTNNILILNLDGGSANASITSSSSNQTDKIKYQVKAINGLPKGKMDLIDNLMFKIILKFNENIKKEILDSPLSLIKLRKICEKMRSNLIQNDYDVFNIGEILDNYDEKVVISRNDYDNCFVNFYNDIKILISDIISQAKLKEEDINDIIFIGELCREKNFEKLIEQSFKQFSSIYEELIYSNYMDNEKDFYIVGGAAFHALNSISNNKIYSFNDISPVNIGIEKYNGYMDLLVNKGDKIPIINKKSVKISNESNQLKIYEIEDNDSMKKKLIKVIEIENNEIYKDINGYRKLKIEYEFNEKLELNIKVVNGEKILSINI